VIEFECARQGKGEKSWRDKDENRSCRIDCGAAEAVLLLF